MSQSAPAILTTVVGSYPIPAWLAVVPKPPSVPLDDDDGEMLGPSDSRVRKLRLARLARRGYPKTLPCLGCGCPMKAESPGHRFHQACRTEADPCPRARSG